MSTVASVTGTVMDQAPPRQNWWVVLSARAENSNAASSILAIADQGMISATNFLTAIVVGRCCGAETLGLYSLVASALAILMGIQEQLITAPYVMFHHRRRGHGKLRYKGSILIHQLIFTSCAFVALLVLSAFSTAVPSLFQTIETVLLVLLPAMLLRAFIREVALAHCRVLSVLLIDAVVCVSQLIAIAVLFACDMVSLPALYRIIGVACLLTTVVWMKHQGSQTAFDSRTIQLDWLRNWRFGRWALATHMAGTSTPYVMPWVLYVWHGEQATGFLASCSVIVGIANILLSGMSDFLTPRAATAYATGGIMKLQRMLSSMAIISAFAIGSVCLLAFLFGESMISVLYDGQFSGAGDLVTLLTLAVLANAFGNVAGNGLWALNQPRANFVADLITLTSAIAAALIFVKSEGAYGAALAILLASVIGASARIGIYRRTVASIGRA